MADTRIDGCAFDPGIWTCEREVGGSNGGAFLVGDSHALSLSPTVLYAGAGLGLDVAVRTRTGCSFARFDPSGPRQAQACERWVDEILEKISADRPGLVILHQCPRIGVECSGTGGEWLKHWSWAVSEVVMAIRRRGSRC